MTDQISRIDGTGGVRRHFRHFDDMMAAFVGVLLLFRSPRSGLASSSIPSSSHRWLEVFD